MNDEEDFFPIVSMVLGILLILALLILGVVNYFHGIRTGEAYLCVQMYNEERVE